MLKKYRIISDRYITSKYFRRNLRVLFNLGIFLCFTILVYKILGKESSEVAARGQNISSPPRSDKIKVIIISSMPRSGSTLLGSLLTSYDQTVKYYFEPDQYIETNKCLKSDSCTVEFFNNILSCREDTNFHQWLKKKRMFFNYYTDDVRQCTKSGDYSDCVKDINLISDCEMSDMQLIKNIRTPLRVVEELLELHSDLKVIHLIRDPRGSLNSIKKFGWHTTEETRCKVLLDDLLSFEKLKQKFPNRIQRLSYEVFCLKPIEETMKLSKFLFDLDEIPETTKEFLNTHVFADKNMKGSMSTVKNSTNQYQSWRWKISPEYLGKIENLNECRESILKMDHNLFETISNARNEKYIIFNDKQY